MEGTKEQRYVLTVYYVGPNGETIAPTRRKSCVEGLLIVIKSPVILGMRADPQVIAVNLYQDETRTVHYERMKIKMGGGEP